jgi:hypothetical protein
MPRNYLVAKVLDFLFRDADPPHGLGHLADDAEVISRTIKSHKHLGIFGGHREGSCADMSVAICRWQVTRSVPKTHQRRAEAGGGPSFGRPPVAPGRCRLRAWASVRMPKAVS